MYLNSRIILLQRLFSSQSLALFFSLLLTTRIENVSKSEKKSPTKRENVSKRNPETNCFFRFFYITLKGTWIITTKKKRFVVVLCLNDFRNILFGGLEHEFNQGHIVTLAKLSQTNASSLLCIAYMHSPLAAALLYTSPDHVHHNQQVSELCFFSRFGSNRLHLFATVESKTRDQNSTLSAEEKKKHSAQEHNAKQRRETREELE